MTTSALAAVNPTPELLPPDESKELLPKLKSTRTHEVVIALCGPIGAPTKDVALQLEAELRDVYAYSPTIIKLSDYIKTYPDKLLVVPSGGDRYVELIERGNRLRETYGNSVLAELAVTDISIRRDQSASVGGQTSTRFCHIIDSIKNVDELRALREVYGRLLICIGVYASVEDREARLIGRGVKAEQIQTLIHRDSGEEKASGQTVSEVFYQSDLFLTCGLGGAKEIREKLKRITELVFGTKVVTPTMEEIAMYSAYTASLNSACLSRQVGAAVTDAEGNILGLGWNDVPKYGGGVCGEGKGVDGRCFNHRGICHNDDEKSVISEELADILIEEKLLLTTKKDVVIKAIKTSRLKSLIEFSRAVHAEMLALLNATRNGANRVIGGNIFVTTYPCHACARHIVAAGIHKVYYIEPYRKSLAIKLHGDAISELPSKGSKVELVPFEGVSPSRYGDFFKMPATGRKKDGKLTELSPKDALFRTEASLKSLPMLEKIVVKKLIDQKLINIREVT